jgi:hypothetical protein
MSPRSRLSSTPMLVPCSTANKAVRATFVTSCVVYSRALPKGTAEFTAPRAMQNDAPR